MTWQRITCDESNFLHATHDLVVASGFTDMDGEHGDPEVRREWADKATGALVVKDVRYPPPIPMPPLANVAPRPDTRPCEHYRYEATE